MRLSVAKELGESPGRHSEVSHTFVPIRAATAVAFREQAFLWIKQGNGGVRWSLQANQFFQYIQ